MIFFLICIISIIYANVIDRLIEYNKISYNHLRFPYFFLPLALFWVYICGSQYYVGTDYESYIKIFNGYNLEYFSNNGEILFTKLIQYCNVIGLRGQALYYIIYAISFYFFFLILKETKIIYSAIYILLYIAVSTIFNGQFNILRQSLAVYIGTYAAILTIRGKYVKPIILICIASMFHISSISFIIFLFPKSIINKLNKTALYLLLISGFFLSLILSVSVLDRMLDIIPNTYSWYIQNDDLGEQSTLTSLTKYIFIPLYLLAIDKLPKLNLSKSELILFKWGIISFVIRIALLNLALINRLSYSFVLISMFPLYYYIIYLMKNNPYRFSFIISLILIFYAFKVIIFPSGEYIYQSIMFS